MNIKLKQRLLEGIGMGRMILGIAQIIALTGGYFLREIMLRTPQEAYFYIVDQDVLTLTYVAIILRSLFHIVTGIAISRAKEWGKLMIFYGWPLIVIITVGLVLSNFQLWFDEKMVTGIIEVISFGGVMLYCVFVLFDFAVVIPAINSIQIKRKHGVIKGEFAKNKIVAVSLMAVLLFSVLIFMGKPVKEGFHRGFYKTKGIIEPQGQEELAGSQADTGGIAGVTGFPSDDPGEDLSALLEKSKQKISRDVDDGINQQAVGKHKGLVPFGMPYRAMVGYGAGILIIMGFAFQLLGFEGARSGRMPQASYIFFCAGFLLWIFYGVTFKLPPVMMMGVVSLVLCLSIIATDAYKKK